MVDAALARAGVGLDDVDGIAVTRGPGLVGSLLVGLSVAKGIALRARLPLVGVNHLEGHLLAANLDRDAGDPVPFPVPRAARLGRALGALPRARGPATTPASGETRDDAVGEAFDKVGEDARPRLSRAGR